MMYVIRTAQCAVTTRDSRVHRIQPLRPMR